MATKAQYLDLKKKADVIEAQVQKLMAALKAKETKVVAGEQAQASMTQKLYDHMKSMPAWAAPGNVGDINRVFWPFWFTTDRVDLVPESQQASGFSISQEAAFIMVEYTKAVYVKDVAPAPLLSYVDPDAPAGAGKTRGLSMTLRDSLSQRQFMGTSILLDHVGHPRFPTEFDTPQLVLPNANMEVQFFNDNADVTFTPFITVFGIRVRIEEMHKLLATVGDF